MRWLLCHDPYYPLFSGCDYRDIGPGHVFVTAGGSINTSGEKTITVVTFANAPAMASVCSSMQFFTGYRLASRSGGVWVSRRIGELVS